MRIAIVVLTCLLAVLGGALPERASAGHDVPCADADITRAVTEVTGNVPLGRLCNPRLYDGGQWATYAELKSHVTATLNACGATATNRNLTQAVIEVTGVVPDGAVCAKGIYQGWVNETDTTGFPPTIDWSQYKGSSIINSDSVYGAVYGTFYTCSRPEIAQAVIRQTGLLPNRADATGAPQAGANSIQTMGQCNPALYNSGDIYSWVHLVQLVQERWSSTTTCGIPWITQAVRELTGGWNPLPGECDAIDYGGASWSGYQELKSRIFASWRCHDPWIGQAYQLSVVGRKIRGTGAGGECNPYLYGTGSWSSYTDLVQKVGVASGSLAAANVELRPSGKAIVDRGGVTVTVPAQEVLIGNSIAGVISAGSGNLLSDKGQGLIGDHGSGLVSLPGGSVVSAGGGNVISAGSLNLIGGAGGNVISAGGGNVVSAGALN